MAHPAQVMWRRIIAFLDNDRIATGQQRLEQRQVAADARQGKDRISGICELTKLTISCGVTFLSS